MDAKAVGQRIKTAREKKNMTQEDLAALVDISPTHVSVIERGSKIPRLDMNTPLPDGQLNRPSQTP